MPFASKYRASMSFPLPGEMLETFLVESVAVRDVQGGRAGYRYDIEVVVQGPGGKSGALRAFRGVSEAHPLTFSGYGNPYQLWMLKPEIESLGRRRYRITATGAGARIWLQPEFERLLDHMQALGLLPDGMDEQARDTMLSDYMRMYTHEVRLSVGRYRAKVKRRERQAAEKEDATPG
jgi:hypothetical protein